MSKILKKTLIATFIAAAGLIASQSQASACTLATAPPVPIAGAVTSARHIRTTADDKAAARSTGDAKQQQEAIAWDTRFIVDVESSFNFQGGVIAFAVPLEPGETLVNDAAHQGISAATNEAGRIVGICVEPQVLRERAINVSFIQPVTTAGAATFRLGAPISTSNSTQIIEGTVDGSAAEARLDVLTTGSSSSTPSSLERHVGYIAPRAISHAAREEARRLTETQAHVTSSPIYVRGDDVRASNGLSGHIVDAHARAKGSAFSVGLLFAGIVSALVFAARRLTKSAGEEHAEAVLAAEIDAVSTSSTTRSNGASS